MRQLGVASLLGGIRADRLPSAQLVVVANVEHAATNFANKAAGLHSRFERTFSKAYFRRTFSDQLLSGASLSETDVDVLLTFLSRDKGLILYDGQTIKIKSTVGSDEDSTHLTEDDASVAQLRELLAYLSHQTSILSARIDELNAAAHAAVAKKNRVAALAALRSKKLAEKSLEQRFTSLSQLEEVAARIEQAADNLQLVRVMEASGQALKNLNAATGGADRVEDVVSRLREQMDQADELNSILSEGVTAPVDEGELDDELAALEGEENKKIEEAERARKEEEMRKQAEEIRKRLEAIPDPGRVPVGDNAKSDQVAESPTKEAVDSLNKLSLDEPREAEPAS
jgi:charged multivesicular body protein 7